MSESERSALLTKVEQISDRKKIEYYKKIEG